MSEQPLFFKEKRRDLLDASNSDAYQSLVPRARLELARLSTPDPKSGASANFATSATLNKGYHLAAALSKRGQCVLQCVLTYALASKDVRVRVSPS